MLKFKFSISHLHGNNILPQNRKSLSVIKMNNLLLYFEKTKKLRVGI